MLLNVDKGKVMLLGVNSENVGYFMDNRQLEAVVDERDLGIIMQNNWKVSKQCAKVDDTANRVLGMIYRTVHINQENMIFHLCKNLVRPHPEYCTQAWCPHFKKDIDFIKKVQQKATITIVELRHLP